MTFSLVKKIYLLLNTKIVDYQKFHLIFATRVSISVFIVILVKIAELEYLRL